MRRCAGGLQNVPPGQDSGWTHQGEGWTQVLKLKFPSYCHSHHDVHGIGAGQLDGLPLEGGQITETVPSGVAWEFLSAFSGYV